MNNGTATFAPMLLHGEPGSVLQIDFVAFHNKIELRGVRITVRFRACAEGEELIREDAYVGYYSSDYVQRSIITCLRRGHSREPVSAF